MSAPDSYHMKGRTSSGPSHSRMNIHPLTAMTKAEEMQRYDAFVASLPQDSYLRPWLRDIRDQVATDLRNDIIPEMTPREAYAQCIQARKEAAAHIRRDLDRKRQDAARIIAEATAKAASITARVEQDAEATRRELQDDIFRLRHALNALAGTGPRRLRLALHHLAKQTA